MFCRSFVSSSLIAVGSVLCIAMTCFAAEGVQVNVNSSGATVDLLAEDDAFEELEDLDDGEAKRKMANAIPAKKVKLGDDGLKDAPAQVTAQEKSTGDAATLLENTLKDLYPVHSLVSASVRPETQKILQGNDIKIDDQPLPDDKVALRYLCEVRLDRQKYFAEFLPNLKRVLEQISVTPPKEVQIKALEHSYAPVLADYMAGKGVPYGYRGIHGQFRRGGRTVGILDQVHVYEASWNDEDRTWPLGYQLGAKPDRRRRAESQLKIASFNKDEFKHTQPRPVEVVMITDISADASSGKACVCVLDASTEIKWRDWIERVLEVDFFIPNGVTRFNIVLQDKNGSKLEVIPWEVPTANLMCMKFADMRGSRARSQRKTAEYSHVFITPFVGCFGESYIEWKDMIVSKSVLPKIDSITIELAQ